MLHVAKEACIEHYYCGDLKKTSSPWVGRKYNYMSERICQLVGMFVIAVMRGLNISILSRTSHAKVKTF